MVAKKRVVAKVAKKVSRKSPEYSTVRKSCAPGTVAIILAGRFRGRRAVILKQLPNNGPLVVSGPMKYNGVPVRRIDSRYVIATTTKVDVSGVDVKAITPEVFARPKAAKPAKSEGDFMGDKQKKAAEKSAKKTSKASKKSTVSPDGTVVEDGSHLRDEFHFTKYSDAEVFVPCGGRPRSVTLENVGGFLKVPDATGEAMLEGKFEGIHPDQLKFKIIVEGANLFISQDARLALEKCGVVLIKDASANKGGVTSSSLEVYVGLALSDEEHAKHMSVKPGQPEPAFYKSYVQEIVKRVDENAQREFDAIWREWEKNPSQPKTLIADALSNKNVQIRANMLASDIFQNKDLVRYVLLEYTPKTLLEVVPINTLMERVPENYQHAICAMYLASRYVYETGVHSNEFDFFSYMTDILKNVEVMKQSKV